MTRRVAVVGAGPAGFYAAEALLAAAVEVDLYEALPAPFGLVRYGVAPDHAKIKQVERVYERIAATPGFRFLGHVALGSDVALDELRRRYDAVIVSIGCPSSRRLDIAGEDLHGSMAATDLVAWYNGHPSGRDLRPRLDVSRAVVVGVGNVAVDVARILVRSPDELATTDIDADALAALRASSIREVTILGRRGPAQAAFALKEVKELAELAGVTFTVDPIGFELPAILPEERERKALIEFLSAHLNAPIRAGDRVVRLRLAASPAEIVGEDGQVGGLRIVRNHVEADGSLVPTRVFDHLDAGLVVRAVGYRGVPPVGVPFDPRTGCIPNDGGRVLDAPGGAPVRGVYAAGWVKRGPSGLVGTNRACARETVTALVADLDGAAAVAQPPAEVDAWLAERGLRPVTWDDWRRIDAREQALGAAEGRPRRKLSTVDALLEAAAAPAP